MGQTVRGMIERDEKHDLPFALDRGYYPAHGTGGIAMSELLDFEGLRRLAMQSPEQRFREHFARQSPEPVQLREPVAAVPSEPLTVKMPAFQDRVRKEAVAFAVHQGSHVSARRGGHRISGADEVTELLFHIFTAAAHRPGTMYRVADRYEITVTEQLGEAEEDLLYALLSIGSRNVEDGEKVVAVKPSRILDMRGIGNQTRNREAAKASLRKLFNATAFVKDLRTGWEDGIRLIRRIRVERATLFDVVLSDDLLALFDEPAFPLMLDMRKQLKTRDSFRVLMRLQFYAAFRNGQAVSLDRATLIDEVGWARLKQLHPRKVVERIVKELAGAGVRCTHADDYGRFRFQKQ